MVNENRSDVAGGAAAPPPAADSSAAWQRRLMEALDVFWNRWVDPEDAFFDDDGARWMPMPGTAALSPWGGLAFTTEAQLREIRGECRVLALTNEFAINGHENRVSYIVGTGHRYRATPRGADASPQLAAEVQAALDEFAEQNRWQQRQQEIVRRKDRDGECFLRFFDARDGSVRIRFVEPEQVSTPPAEAGNPAASFGIVTDAQDVETVRGYYVDGRWIDADEIQHRKANVDANVKRGIPLFFPVRKNLRRVDKLLRNMSVVAEIQSAIALIRKHAAGSAAAIEQFVQRSADVTVVGGGAGGAGGRASNFRRYGPGTILDVLAGTDYQFPAAGIDAGRYVTVLQAELRAIASRLVMPEFMLSSDASNANYSSTMVAEGPATRMFERLQHEMIEDDLAVMRHVVAAAAAAGRLPALALSGVQIRAVPPPLAVRNRLQEAQADQILVRNGAMSVQTMAMRNSLDPDHEQQLIAKRPAVQEHNFNPDEPRDEYGRWTAGGAGERPPAAPADGGKKKAYNGAAAGSTPKGSWDPGKVGALLNGTEAGKAVKPGIQAANVKQCEHVRSYYQERSKASDPWPTTWKSYEWGAMTTHEGAKPTLHIPADNDTYEAARFLVHEGTHAMGKGEQEAYEAEQQFAIELLKRNPNDEDAKKLLRPGMYKQGKDGLEVDKQGITNFLNKPAESEYPAWEGTDPLKRFMKDEHTGGNKVDYGHETEVKIPQH